MKNPRATPTARPALVLGLMSGTSLDAVDLALCRVTLDRVELEAHWQVDFPAALRRRLSDAARGGATSWETGQLHHDLGRFYAHAALGVLGRRRPDLVGLHGQTIYHRPPDRGRRAVASATFQLGEPAWLAEALRVPVVSNFRAADLAAGGEGAPLATLFHQVVFAEPGRFVCVNNLGGISNVTALDARRRGRMRVMAFDTGPANLPLDLAVRAWSRGRLTCDRDGRGAARGRVDEARLKRWLRHPFLRCPPPKSTGREMFGEDFLAPELRRVRPADRERCDLLATLTEFTARSLAAAYRRFLHGWPDRVVLAGGGAANPFLVGRISAALEAVGPTEVVTSAALGWPLQAIEPAAFALLAHYRRQGLPANLPATTGAARAVPLGQVTEP